MSGEFFTVEHFEAYASLMVFDDGERRGVEDWQLGLVEDLFAGFRRNLWVVPEGNGKSTFVAILALYGADFSDSPWIPIGASSAKQARIIHDQATGFINRTPGMEQRFKSFGGYRLIRVLNTRARRERGWSAGIGIEVFAADPGTGDGVIPYPYGICDELHRHPDMRLWDLWGGKLRKRGAQMVGISTAGEPESPFETMRDEIRRRAVEKAYEGAHLRASAPGEVLHEWMVAKDEETSDMAKVKEANPLSTITEATLQEDYAVVTDLGAWKQLKCSRPTRSTKSAISDREWDDARYDGEIPAGDPIELGIDVAWKWDTTAIVPLWHSPNWVPGVKADPKQGIKSRAAKGYRLLGEPRVLVPPRDGSTLHPDEVKSAVLEFVSYYQVVAVVMDLSKAEDIASWIEDELGITVIDHDQGNTQHVADYDSFMEGLRSKTLKHTGDQTLQAHCLNAVARRLPGGDYRFDRPNASRGSAKQQDRRVIDGLTAAAAVVNEAGSAVPKRKSAYAERGVVAA